MRKLWTAWMACGMAAAVAVGCGSNAKDPAAIKASGKKVAAGQADAVQLEVATGGPAQGKRDEKLQPYAVFNGPMPTGVTVSRNNRIFLSFPRWGDPVKFTVGELKGGRLVAYPDEMTNTLDATMPTQRLVSVQSVVVDRDDRLWCLDTGSLNFAPVVPNSPKLVAYDLSTNKVAKTISFPDTVCLPTSYLNDVRFDLTRGKAGMAFITDSSTMGDNGIIVVDLETGECWRKLHKHPSTSPEPDFKPTVEGREMAITQPGQPPAGLDIGSDGIALSADGQTLFYCPLASRKIYGVDVEALVDRNRSDEDVARTIQDLGTRNFASDGLLMDGSNRLYLTDYEHNAVQRLTADGNYETIVQDERALWPDTLWLADDGHLYFTANQLHRQPRFRGKDERVQPYVLFRVKTDAMPITSR